MFTVALLDCFCSSRAKLREKLAFDVIARLMACLARSGSLSPDVAKHVSMCWSNIAVDSAVTDFSDFKIGLDVQPACPECAVLKVNA